MNAITSVLKIWLALPASNIRNEKIRKLMTSWSPLRCLVRALSEKAGLTFPFKVEDSKLLQKDEKDGSPHLPIKVYKCKYMKNIAGIQPELFRWIQGAWCCRSCPMPSPSSSPSLSRSAPSLPSPCRSTNPITIYNNFKIKFLRWCQPQEMIPFGEASFMCRSPVSFFSTLATISAGCALYRILILLTIGAFLGS